METRSTFSNAVYGMFAASALSYKRVDSSWKNLWAMKSTNKPYEEEMYASDLGYLYQKPEATPFSFDMRIQGPRKRWTPITYGLGVRISQEAKEDDLWGFMKTIAKDLGAAAAHTRHFLAIRTFMNGTNTTFHTTGFGNALFSNTHPRLDGGTFDNLEVAATPTSASLTSAIYALEAIPTERGMPQDYEAMSVLCGPSLEFTFQKLLGSQYEPETPNNAINPIYRRKINLQIDRRITDARWFVCGKKDTDHGFIWFDRVKPSISQHGDPDTGDLKFYIRMRCINECNHPSQMVMVPA